MSTVFGPYDTVYIDMPTSDSVSDIVTVYMNSEKKFTVDQSGNILHVGRLVTSEADSMD